MKNKGSIILTEIKKHFKLESLIILCSIIFYIICNKELTKEAFMSSYFTIGRLGVIIDFISIGIGIYIAIISIFASSATILSKILIEKRLENSLVAVTSVGLSEMIILIVSIIFFSEIDELITYVIFILTILPLISFMKFFMLIIKMYKFNLAASAKEIDDDENYKTDLLVAIEKIEKSIKK